MIKKKGGPIEIPLLHYVLALQKEDLQEYLAEYSQ
jgi:hypothetical protein